MKLFGKAVKKLTGMHVIISLCILVLLNLVFFQFCVQRSICTVNTL
jgi:hypothetical protein